MKEYPYGSAARFEGVNGTNPEELLGAAHAGCFTMALSLILGEANLKADRMETTATVSLEQKGGGFEVTSVLLNLKAKIPGATKEQFQELANKAKANCPLSKVLKANIALEAVLE